MLPPGLRTPREVSLYYDSLYETLVSSGRANPFLYPWAGIGASIVLAYLLIDHRRNTTLRSLQHPLFCFFFAFQCWLIATNRARRPAPALGVGLLSAWSILWVSRIMMVNDGQTDFKRIESAPDQIKEPHHSEGALNGSVSNGVVGGLHRDDAKSSKSNQATIESLAGRFFWQTYPDSFSRRLDWITDVFCNFRGVGWNWQSTTVPPLPKAVEMPLQGKVDYADSKTISTSRIGIRRFANRELLFQNAYRDLTIGYLALDLIKVLMHHDAYFWGYMDAAPPSYFPIWIQNSYFLIRSYRLLLGLSAMYTALWTIFKLGPLFFCRILGPKWIGLRGEPWMNPADMFGSFKCVLENGLAGWWGGWWHQTFRVAFEAHSTFLLNALEIEKRSLKGQLISLLLAFFLSGCLHACGSVTMLGETRPLMGPMRFFLLQPIGIVTQLIATAKLSEAGVLQNVPKAVKQLANLAIVHAWLYFSAPLLIDDFAKGGVFLFEPIVLSPLRLLGLGATDDRFFCWDGILSWHSGKRWWNTGMPL